MTVGGDEAGAGAGAGVGFAEYWDCYKYGGRRRRFLMQQLQQNDFV